MKKKLIILGCIGVTLVVLFVLNIKIDPFDMYWNEGEKDNYDTFCEKINNLYSEIYVYGEDMHFRDSFKRTQLKELTEESIVTSDDGKYKWLIINDISGTVELSENEIQLISSKVLEFGISFIYVGQKYIESFNKYIAKGDDRYLFEKDEHSVAYESLESGIVACHDIVDDSSYEKFTSNSDYEELSLGIFACMSMAENDFKH